MSQNEYPVFIKRGDARAEVDAVLQELEKAHAPGAELGFLKYLYVAKAHQTVVMVARRDAPLAAALRGRKGWQEPTESA